MLYNAGRGQRLTSLARCPRSASPFVVVATNDSLVVLDARKATHPVLSLSHPYAHHHDVQVSLSTSVTFSDAPTALLAWSPVAEAATIFRLRDCSTTSPVEEGFPFLVPPLNSSRYHSGSRTGMSVLVDETDGQLLNVFETRSDGATWHRTCTWSDWDEPSEDHAGPGLWDDVLVRETQDPKTAVDPADGDTRSHKIVHLTLVATRALPLS